MAKTFSASHRMARISPFKARPVVNLVRGKPVQAALDLLAFEPRRAASMLTKVIRSALANASSDLEVKLNRLMVVEAKVDGGPLLNGRMRFRPGPMGRGMPIHKRTSHISVKLAEAEAGTETQAEGSEAAAARPRTRKRATKPASTPSAKPARNDE